MRLEIDNDTPFERQGNDLHLSLPVTLSTAVLGGAIEVPTLEKSVKMSIPAGTDSGRRMRLKGKGIPAKKNPGDLYITIQIVVPKDLDDEARARFESFVEAAPQDLDA